MGLGLGDDARQRMERAPVLLEKAKSSQMLHGVLKIAMRQALMRGGCRQTVDAAFSAVQTDFSQIR